jgi:hypothetical protein
MACLACVQRHSQSVDLSHKYRAFDPNFRDEDLPPPPDPELLLPPQCNGNWWKSMPRSQPTYSANERLRGLYQSIDFACKSGFFR